MRKMTAHFAESEPKLVSAIISEDWRAQIVAYLKGHYEPESEVDRKRMAARARSFVLRGENLYKAGVCAPLLKCVSREEGK